jgi:ribosomal-protein-serine acetyltransferase
MFELKIDSELTLRTLEEADAPLLFETVDTNRDYIGEYLPWVDDTKSPEDSLAFIRRVRAEFKSGETVPAGLWYGGELVGHIGIQDIRRGHKAEIGYWLAENAAGKGLMTKAARAMVRYSFVELGLVKLVILARTTNQRSINVARRLGFRPEGVERAGEMHRGEFHDLEHFGLLKGE